MNKKITILTLIFLVVGIIFIIGYIQYIQPLSFKKSDKINKYSTKKIQYLATGNPIKYTFEEVEQKTKIIIHAITKNKLSENVEKKCLNEVYKYIYAFPGYEYNKISGTARTGSGYDKNANVNISINANGLLSGIIATKVGKQYGDKYTFDLKYDEDTKECELLSYHFFNWIIPKEIYNNAVLLAMEHPVVKNFINNSKNYNFYFNEWIDDYKGKGTNYKKVLTEINFKQPIKGIIVLNLRNSMYSDLWVYVDIFNGDVFTEAPIYNPPR